MCIASRKLSIGYGASERVLRYQDERKARLLTARRERQPVSADAVPGTPAYYALTELSAALLPDELPSRFPTLSEYAVSRCLAVAYFATRRMERNERSTVQFDARLVFNFETALNFEIGRENDWDNFIEPYHEEVTQALPDGFDPELIIPYTVLVDTTPEDMVRAARESVPLEFAAA